MLSLLSLLNVYKTSTTVTQKWKAAVLKKNKIDFKMHWERQNSPRLCLLAFESFRASLWPMELRNTIASANSPSCIVPVAFSAMQGPPLQPDGSGGGAPFLCGTGGSLCCWDDDPSSLCGTVLVLSLPFPPPLSLSIFHSSDCWVRKSV